MKFSFLFLSFFIIGVYLNNIQAGDSDSDESVKPDKIGNFSLRGSQQPGPLVGFGEHVIDKGEVQFYLLADALTGPKNYKTDIFPIVVYGITDRFSITTAVPYSPKNKNASNKSEGLKDIIIQLEYAYYLKYTKTTVDQATIVANVTLPTGSSTKNPTTGYGSTSYMLGLTYNHTAIKWFYFGFTGFIVPQKHRAYREGSEFLYQAGIGRNIATPPGWIFAGMIEFIGEYSWKNTVNNHKDPNSGGNLVYVVPSLWLSSEKVILQLGIGYPIAQHLFGHQLKQRLSYYFNFGWTF